MPQGCLDEEIILAFLDRSLPPGAVESVEAHIDACQACRSLIGHLAQAGTPATTSVAPSSSALASADPSGTSRWTVGPGDRVDHFEIQRQIGRGGMGEIYLARDETLGREVALKLISPELVASEHAREQLLVEAQATARINHPHVVAIHSIGQHGLRPYLALEYLEGETLRQRMDRGGVDAVEALRWSYAVAQALAEAHEHGVLHLDLKPQNVVLATDGRLRVLDFGLAKLARMTGALEEATSPETQALIEEAGVRGTPGYMSPEQWRGGPLSRATDVWSFGMLLYELLSGARPYREPSALAFALRVCEADPAPSLPPDLPFPRHIRQLVDSCLAKSPAARPTAAEVVRALEEALGDTPLRVLEQLDRAAQSWAAAGEPADNLWDGVKLDEAQQALQRGALPVAPAAVRFMAASSERTQGVERARRQRLTTATALALAGALLAAVLALLTASQTREARRQRSRAEEERAAALVEGARRALDQGDHLEARAKIRSALETSDAAEARLLWWRLDGEPLLASRAIGTGLFAVAFAPDGRTVAAAGQDRNLYLLDVPTLTMDRRRGHRDQVLRLAYSADGATLISADWGGEIRLWDLDRQRVRVERTTPPAALAMSATGHRLAYAGRDGSVLLWDDVRAPRPPRQLASQRAVSIGLSFTPDGKELLSAEPSGEVLSWSLGTGDSDVVVPAEKGRAPLSAFALGPHGTFLATGDERGRVAIWDRGESKLLHQLEGASRAVRALVFDPEGRRLFTASQDGSIRRWDQHTEELTLLGEHASAVWSLTISPDGDLLASAGLDREVRLWHAQRRRLTAGRGGHTDGVAAVAISRSGELMASGSYDRTIRLWDARTGHPRRSLEGHSGTIYGLDFSPDGTRLASASHDATVGVWDLETGQVVHRLTGHEGGVYDVAFSPSGLRLASGGADGTVRLWDPRAGLSLRARRGHRGPVFEVAWRPDGARVASAGADHRVALWESDLEANPRVLRGHTAAVWGVAFSPDGRQLASGGYDRSVRLWDLTSGSSESVGTHIGRVYAVAFHPDGNRIAAVGSGGDIRVWPTESAGGAFEEQIRGEVNDVVISADGRSLIVATDEGTVRGWDLPTRRPLWHAALLLPNPPRLATRLGWRELSAEHAPLTTSSTAWERQVVERATRASVAPETPLLCLADFDGGLELWDRREDRPLFTTACPGVSDVVALDSGCLSLANGAARLYDRAGAYLDLGGDVRSASWSPAAHALLLTTDEQLRLYEPTGELRQSLPLQPGATATAYDGTLLFIGYDDGTIERISLVDGEEEAPAALTATPGGAVTALALGPAETLLAGYGNGQVRIWHRVSGRELLRAGLHGAVVHLAVGRDAVVVASELGDTLGPIDALQLDHCALLRRVWARSSVVWSGGVASVAGAPREHRCQAGE